MYFYLYELCQYMYVDCEQKYYDHDLERLVSAAEILTPDEARYAALPQISYTAICIDYLNQYYDRKLKKYLLDRADRKDFNAIFYRFLEEYRLFDQFAEFENKAMSSLAEAWCQENGICYSKKPNSNQKTIRQILTELALAAKNDHQPIE